MIYGNASWGFREMDLEEQLKITAKWSCRFWNSESLMHQKI